MNGTVTGSWPGRSTVMRATTRNAAVRGATFGNAIVPCFAIVTLPPPSPAPSRKAWAMQRTSAGLTVRPHDASASCFDA